MECLRRRLDESRQIQQIGHETLPLLEEVRTCLEDQGRVNRLIARIDVHRARMRELDNCYDLVTQLTQRTQLVRFRNDRLLHASRATGTERQRRQIERDMANVQGIIEAAGQFEQLISSVIEKLAI